MDTASELIIEKITPDLKKENTDSDYGTATDTTNETLGCEIPMYLTNQNSGSEFPTDIKKEYSGDQIIETDITNDGEIQTNMNSGGNFQTYMYLTNMNSGDPIVQTVIGDTCIKNEPFPPEDEKICDLRRGFIPNDDQSWDIETTQSKKNNVNRNLRLPGTAFLICDHPGCGKRFLKKDHFENHQDFHKGINSNTCKSCGKSYKHYFSLKYHIYRVHTNKLPFVCKHCDKSFKCRWSLKYHMRTHIDKKNRWQKCTICEKMVCYLSYHIKRCHSRVICEYPGCGQSFDHSTDLNKHKKLHTKLNQEKEHCHICRKQFKNSKNLLRHLTYHNLKHKCTICDKVFRDNRDLKTHMCIHNGEKNYVCGVCGKKFLRPGSLTLHMVIHSDVKRFVCDVCGKQFRCKNTLKDHTMVHSDKRQFKCTICSKTFRMDCSLRRHKYTHMKDNDKMRYHCDVCGKGFHLKQTLETHMMSHIDKKERRQECIICGKMVCVMTLHVKKFHPEVICDYPGCGEGFDHSMDLYRHKQIHPKQDTIKSKRVIKPRTIKSDKGKISVQTLENLRKIYTCDICGESSEKRNKILYHMNFHNPKHPCTFCEKLFRTLGDLKIHMNTHTKEKVSVCDVCGKEFNRKSSLKTHMNIHTGNKVKKEFACDLCGIKFGCKMSLTGHMSIHTGKKDCVCNICGVELLHTASLKAHMWIHTGVKNYMCVVCGNKFKNKTLLEEHSTVHSDIRKYNCDICSKSYKAKSALRRHKLTHNDKMPHQCDNCGKEFTQKTSLNNHMKSAKCHNHQKPHDN